MWRRAVNRSYYNLQSGVRNVYSSRSGFSNHPNVDKVIASRSCCTMTTAPPQEGVKVSVEPPSCLHDESVNLHVDGLQPGQNVTLEASMVDTRGVRFLSFAHYKADGLGQVDVNKMESLGGSYEGVFPMGLLSSLSPALQKDKFTRFFKRDVENPNIVALSVLQGHLSKEEINSEGRSEPLSTTTHLRHYMAPGVQRIPVRYGKVRGCLFLPPGDGPFPGVVDMFGSAGGLLEYRSAQLASRGIASLALAFFAYDDLPKTLEEFDISYFEEAVEFLLKHDKVISRGVGVIGTSKGGELALTMASFIPSVIACVAINNLNFPFLIGYRVGEHSHPGAPLNPDFSMFNIKDDGSVAYVPTIPDHNFLQKFAIPIERSNAAFLFLVGSDDRNTNSEYFAQKCCQRLSEHGYSKPYEVLSHPGTGHLLEPPYSPHCYASLQHSNMLAIVWGGTHKHHTQGQVNAWPKMIEFLKHHIVQEDTREVDKETNAIRLKSNL